MKAYHEGGEQEIFSRTALTSTPGGLLLSLLSVLSQLCKLR